MQVQQLFDPGSTTCSYLIWDEATREAALIDPVQDQLVRDTLARYPDFAAFDALLEDLQCAP